MYPRLRIPSVTEEQRDEEYRVIENLKKYIPVPAAHTVPQSQLRIVRYGSVEILQRPHVGLEYF